MVTGEDDYYDLDDYDMDESYHLYVINAILSDTARLNVILSTVTNLAFSTFAPILTNNGACSTLNNWLMGFFLCCENIFCSVPFKEKRDRLPFYAAAETRFVSLVDVCDITNH